MFKKRIKTKYKYLKLTIYISTMKVSTGVWRRVRVNKIAHYKSIIKAIKKIKNRNAEKNYDHM